MASFVTRRRLLQSATLIAGAVLAPGVAAAAESALPFAGRLGALVPESSAGDVFLTGLQLALPNARLTVERLPLGRVAAAEGAQRLLSAGNRRLIGLLGPNLAAATAEALAPAGATLLAVDTGANLLRTEEESPGVLTHSLGLWRGSAALGRWSVGRYGPRGMVLSGFVESGYDMLHAFEIGVSAAGGTPLPAIVTHVPPEPLDWSAVLGQVRAVKPDVVYALYSGQAAVDFLRAWRASGLRLPLVVSPFLVDEVILPLHEGRAEGIVSASSWAPGLDNPANQRFVTSFQTAPDGFALLGYEAGLLAAADFQRVEGPRGWIRPGPVGATRSPLYLRQVVGGANTVVGALPAIDELDPAVTALRSAVRTGWVNPYLV